MTNWGLILLAGYLMLGLGRAGERTAVRVVVGLTAAVTIAVAAHHGAL